MGFNPDTGEELLPITSEIAAVWKPQSSAPHKIAPDDNFEFFDPVTGKSRVWYRRDVAGAFEFFNRPRLQSTRPGSRFCR